MAICRQTILVFLSAYDGAVPPSNTLAGTNDNVSVSAFLRAEDIVSIANQVDGFSKGMVPIAEDGCGNYICIGTSDHKIYFWDHEIEGD
jgi:hypothetical protein